jgi:DNA-binding response OmpR family regulator
VKKVLVLEDEEDIRSMIALNLVRQGYEPVEAGTGAEAFEQMRRNPDIQVAMLDLMLPDANGLDVCRKIRAANEHVGIIMVSALEQETDKVMALMSGADDYVVKPFTIAELMARVDSLFRRIGIRTSVDTVEVVRGPFSLNARNRTVEKNGERIKLTSVEYNILKMFIDNPGTPISREDILNTVWGRDYFGEMKIVDVNIRRLRIKIEDDPRSPEFITTVWGYGYKWGF